MTSRHSLRSGQTENVFTNPPPAGASKDYSANPSYTLNSILDIRWNTNYTDYDLLMWQDLNPCTKHACAIGPYVLSGKENIHYVLMRAIALIK